MQYYNMALEGTASVMHDSNTFSRAGPSLCMPRRTSKTFVMHKILILFIEFIDTNPIVAVGTRCPN